MSLVYTGDLGTYRYGVWKMDAEQQGIDAELSEFPIPELKAAHRKLEFISVRKLAQVMGVDPSNIDYTVSGKPLLRDLPETHISISHSRHYAAFMISKQAYTGIDIEEYSDRIIRIRSRFMNIEEENTLRQLFSKQPYSEKVELIALYLHWCAKEAMYKALDIPGLDFKQDLGIDFCETDGAVHLLSGNNCIEGDNAIMGNNSLPGNSLQNKQGRFKAFYFPQQIRFNIDYCIQEDYLLTCCSSE
ncbi:MAG: 4'-phosphopantetheinyl transferase superfamily protein [Bacteroidales bacterium]|nr:4'-phosphopantetheinyl transferase superfamily protein [Bacteroidales bacterium]